MPHAALRTYVMGERGADHIERPTDDELASMARLVGEALDAGAIGFATSRTEVHRTIGRREHRHAAPRARPSCWPSPTPWPSGGTGVVQLITDCYQTTDDDFAEQELALLEAFARTSRPTAQLHDAAGVPLARAVAAPDGRVGDGGRPAST